MLISIILTAQILISHVSLSVIPESRRIESVFTSAVSHPDISVRELKHDFGRLWLEPVEILPETLTDNPDPAGSASIHAAVFPQRVCHIPACTVQHTAIFNRGPGSQREELQLPPRNLAEPRFGLSVAHFLPSSFLLVPGLQEKNDSCLTIK